MWAAVDAVRLHRKVHVWDRGRTLESRLAYAAHAWSALCAWRHTVRSAILAWWKVDLGIVGSGPFVLRNELVECVVRSEVLFLRENHEVLHQAHGF